jgi:hypothetical protein
VFRAWLEETGRLRGAEVRDRVVEGDLAALLSALLPLSRAHSRHLFLPTAGPWTAYFDNGWQGADAAGAMHLLGRELEARTVVATAGSAAEAEALGIRVRDPAYYSPGGRGRLLERHDPALDEVETVALDLAREDF